jgi:hypothetical protein
MPVEIKELTIQVTIAAEAGASQGTASDGLAASNAVNADAQGAIVQEAVEKVLEILRNKQER